MKDTIKYVGLDFCLRAVFLPSVPIKKKKDRGELIVVSIHLIRMKLCKNYLYLKPVPAIDWSAKRRLLREKRVR
jgi:hypothetical protein